MKNWQITLYFLIMGLSTLSHTTASNNPNILIIYTDDQGYGDVSYLNLESKIQTPNIDRLLEEGICFTHGHSAGLDLSERTLPQALGEAGYKHRGMFGKWHLGRSDARYHPLQRGFTQFKGLYTGQIGYFTHDRMGERDWHKGYEPIVEEGYSTDLIADAASRFIGEAAKDDAPYFCYVPFNAVHKPLDAKPEYVERFGAVDKAMVYTCVMQRFKD